MTRRSLRGIILTMIVYLNGMQEDGSVRSPALPQSNTHPIGVFAAETLAVYLTVTLPSGQPVDLTALGYMPHITIKKHTGDRSAVVSKDFSLRADLGRGRAAVTIAQTDYRQSDPGLYVYDVWLQTSTGAAVACIVQPSVFQLLPSVR